MNNIKINSDNGNIIITKAFHKKACVFGSAEFYELRNAQSALPNAQIEFKCANKRTYDKLTFERMRAYIKTQPNSEIRLMEFESVKTVAETKGAAYPLTKKWFLSTYPKFKENNVSEEEWKTIFSQSVEANKNKAVEDATAESDKVEQFPALATAKASNF